MAKRGGRFEAGDLIYRRYHGTVGAASNAIESNLIYHYGVYIGGKRVVHLTKGKGVHETSLEEFEYGNVAKRENVYTKRSRVKIVGTAEYYSEHPNRWEDYDVMTNNCEHFARYCVTGTRESTQVKTAAAGVGLLGAAATVGKAVIGGIMNLLSDSGAKSETESTDSSSSSSDGSDGDDSGDILGNSELDFANEFSQLQLHPTKPTESISPLDYLVNFQSHEETQGDHMINFQHLQPKYSMFHYLNDK